MDVFSFFSDAVAEVVEGPRLWFNAADGSKHKVCTVAEIRR